MKKLLCWFKLHHFHTLSTIDLANDGHSYYYQFWKRCRNCGIMVLEKEEFADD